MMHRRQFIKLSVATAASLTLTSWGKASASWSMQSSLNKAYSFIDSMMDLYDRGDHLRLIQSYKGGYLGSIGFDPAFTYDNALAIIAYLSRGLGKDKKRATVLGDSLLYVQENDPAADGRVRDAYEPSQLLLEDGTPNIAYRWGQGGSATGNQAWTGLAFLWLYLTTKHHRFLQGAESIGTWILENTYDTRGAGGYMGGVDAANNVLTWKSTEHNIDAYSLFRSLYNMLGNINWKNAADHAYDFIISMWNGEGGFFWTGTGTDGTTTNTYPIPEDVQTWSYLAIQDPHLQRSIDWAAENLAAQDSIFRGVSFSNADTSKVWFEGTAHLALALNRRGAARDLEQSELLIQYIRLAQEKAMNTDGKGIVAASSDGLQTGFGYSYYASLHIGATSWYCIAANRSNPFQP
ncbi:hypothetical protein [Thermobaculum terrenum]|nr:hypothetical protein [Thermobaculum terrenum]